MTCPRIIYHYCSVKSLFNIINSREIWLSNSMQMNDFTETTWINSLIQNKLIALADSKYREFAEKVVDIYNINNSIPYIACFSADGDILSQWRTYSEDATGVAFGISTDKIGIKEQLPVTAASTDLRMGLYRVIYDPKEQATTVDDIFASWIRKIDLKLVDISGASLECAGALKRLSLVFKNPSFSEEMEWRIIHTPLVLLDKQNNVELHGNISDINIRPNGVSLISYFKLSLRDIFDTELLPEIYLGPKCKIDEYDLSIFLSKSGLNHSRVKKSKATYR